MKTFSTSKKEDFFRDYLVPAGQVAELYFHTVRTPYAAPLSNLLFDSLGLTAAYIINPMMPDPSEPFIALSDSVQKIIDVIKGDLLLYVDTKRDTPVVTKRVNANNLPDRLFAPVRDLLLNIGYKANEHSRWVEAIMKVETPLTRKKQYKKWRTFVNHINFRENMEKLGLAECADEMPKLGSAIGRLAAPDLWRECFDTNWELATPTVVKRPVLPARMKVKSNDIGMLEVEMRFDPARYLKKLLATSSEIRDTFKKEVAEARVTKVCSYLDIAAAVEDLLTWEKTQEANAEATRVKIEAHIESNRITSLKQRLQATFTPEELILLEKDKQPTARKRVGRPRRTESTPDRVAD